MLWDLDDLRRHENWLTSRAGAFAFAQERRLFEALTACWPRQGRTFLDIGCGAGHNLENFHESGFSVTGVDKSPVMLQAARERLGQTATLHLAEATHLPFDNDAFDYVGLFTVLEYAADPGDLLLEAVRVAKRGLIVGYRNAFSLYGLCRGRSRSTHQARFFTPWRMRRLLHAVAGHVPFVEASVLPGPPCTWRTGFPLYGLARGLCRMPMGAYCALAADLSAEPPLTGLPAWTARLLTRLRAQSLFDKAGASG
ncbi:class I SAM-dependent methyltransferase [Fundidesulfovibrio butyratiphilus]